MKWFTDGVIRGKRHQRRHVTDDDTPWQDDFNKLECCLPSCFNTSLVFESLGEDMIVVVDGR
jgi:hypothetical protein